MTKALIKPIVFVAIVAALLIGSNAPAHAASYDQVHRLYTYANRYDGAVWLVTVRHFSGGNVQVVRVETHLTKNNVVTRAKVSVKPCAQDKFQLIFGPTSMSHAEGYWLVKTPKTPCQIIKVSGKIKVGNDRVFVKDTKRVT